LETPSFWFWGERAVGNFGCRELAFGKDGFLDQNPKVADIKNEKTYFTFLKFNRVCPLSRMVGRLCSFWDGNFSGAMLNFWGVNSTLNHLKTILRHQYTGESFWV